MIEHWIWWGLGWLFMLRMTIGLMLMWFFGYHDLGLVLAIVGALLDIGSSSSSCS